MSYIDVVVFTKPNCKHSRLAKNLLLKKRGVRLFQVVLDNQPSYSEALSIMKSISNGDPHVPQVVINGRYIPGGYMGLRELDHLGVLNTLLMEEPKPGHPSIARLIRESVSIDVTKLDF